jgi:hypothetical protein
MQQDQAAPSFAVPAPQLYAGALTVTIGGGLAFAGLFGLRLGLGDGLVPVAGMLLLAILPVWLSAWAISAFGKTARSAGLAGMLALFAGMSLPVLGLVAGPTILVTALAALIFCAARGHTPLYKAMRQSWRGLAVMALVTGAQVFLLAVPLRLFMPEAALMGIATSDNYWHLAIMQMILRHDAISIGGDGLLHQNYHFLFHLLVSGTAKATSASIPLAYGYWSALTEKLQVVWALYCAGTLLFRTGGGGAWWRLSYAWIAACLVAGFENESFILGNAYIAAYMPLIMALLRAPQGRRAAFPALLLACAGIFLVATAKVSAGYYGTIGLALLLWTWRGDRRAVVLIALTMAALAAYTELLLIPKELVMSAAGASILAMSYLAYFERGVTLHYLLPAVLVLLYLWRPRGTLTQQPDGAWNASVQGLPPAATHAPLPRWIGEGRGLAKPLRWLAQADVNAQLIFLLLLGTLFVLFAIPIGDNIWDFSGILFGLSLLFLPMALEETLGLRLTDRPVKWLLGILLAINIVWAAALFVFNGADSLPQALVALYRAASGGDPARSSSAKQDLVLSLETTHRPMARLNARIRESAPAKLQDEIARQTVAANGALALHIPPAANDVWRFFLTAAPGKWCLYPHLWAPAVTGTVEIRSIPPRAIQDICALPGTTWYGYGKNQDLHRTGDFSPETLCAMARPLGARRVYRLMSYADLSRNSVLTCR